MATTVTPTPAPLEDTIDITNPNPNNYVWKDESFCRSCICLNVLVGITTIPYCIITASVMITLSNQYIWTIIPSVMNMFALSFSAILFCDDMCESFDRTRYFKFGIGLNIFAFAGTSICLLVMHLQVNDITNLYMDDYDAELRHRADDHPGKELKQWVLDNAGMTLHQLIFGFHYVMLANLIVVTLFIIISMRLSNFKKQLCVKAMATTL